MGSIIGGAIQAGATVDAAGIEAQAAQQAAQIQQQSAAAAVQAAQTGYNYLTTGAGSGAESNYVNAGQTALSNEGTTQNMIAQLLGEAPTPASANWNTSNPAQAPMNLPGNAGMAGYNSNVVNPSYTGPITSGPTSVTGGFTLAPSGSPGNYVPPTAQNLGTPGGAGSNFIANGGSPTGQTVGGAAPIMGPMTGGSSTAIPTPTMGTGVSPSSIPTPTQNPAAAGASAGVVSGAGAPAKYTLNPSNNTITLANGETIPMGGQPANTNGIGLPQNQVTVSGPHGSYSVPAAYANPAGLTVGQSGNNPNALMYPNPANGGNQGPAVTPPPPAPTPTPSPSPTPPSNANSAFQNYLNSTGYQFQLGQGTGAIMANAGSTGLLDSGANAKALEQYGQNLSSTTFNNYLGQLGGLESQQANTAGAGQNSLSTIGATGTASGTAAGSSIMTGAANQGNLMMQGANAQGNAIAGLGGSLGNMFSQFGGVGNNTNFLGGFGGAFSGGAPTGSSMSGNMGTGLGSFF